jgi:predicted cobalt transporter CbtA
LIWTYLRRGLVAGLLAGLLAGLFAYLFAEPVLDRAIELESAAHAGEHSEAVFDRGEQKAGLILATALYGTSAGALFGLLSAFFRTGSEWRRSLNLAGAVFLGAVLLPFLKYPPNPPGVGADPSTLTERTLAYLAMVALGLLAVLAAWRFAHATSLEGASHLVRYLLASAVLAGLWTFLYLAMPEFGPADGHAPAGLVRDFRLSSFGTQVVLWAGIGGVFGLLGERARRRGAL